MTPLVSALALAVMLVHETTQSRDCERGRWWQERRHHEQHQRPEFSPPHRPTPWANDGRSHWWSDSPPLPSWNDTHKKRQHDETTIE